jgi:UDP-2,3-diacylglucosamine hydrolase
LAEFRRQGSSLAIMSGNHDEWLCPFYEAELGATIITEPHDMTIHGIRLRIVHGHLLGARRAWKALMEGRAFFEAFSYVPGPFARALDHVLARRNQRGLGADEERHLRIYGKYAAQFQGYADIVVFGHVHRPVDMIHAKPRLIVLGGWQRRSSFLRIDASGATFHVEHDCDQGARALVPPPAILNPPGRA